MPVRLDVVQDGHPDDERPCSPSSSSTASPASTPDEPGDLAAHVVAASKGHFVHQHFMHPTCLPPGQGDVCVRSRSARTARASAPSEA